MITLYLVVVVIVVTETGVFLFPSGGPGSGVAKLLVHTLLGTVIVAAMLVVIRNGHTAEELETIVHTSLSFGLYGTLIGLLVAGAHVVGAGATLDLRFLVLTAAHGGLLVGIPVGTGYTSLRRTKERAQAQLRERNTVTRRLSVLHRILRHNVRTQVNIVAGYLDRLEEAERQADAADCIETVAHHVDRLESISDNAVRLKRVWETQHERREQTVHALVMRGLDPVADEFPTATVDIEPPPDRTVETHPFAHWAIEETVRNALVHNDPETTTVEVRIEDRHDAVRVTVLDDGSGIPDIEADALGNQVETQLAHGVGLGLQIVLSVTARTNGHLDLEKCEAGGARVSMEFPTLSVDGSDGGSGTDTASPSTSSTYRR